MRKITWVCYAKTAYTLKPFIKFAHIILIINLMTGLSFAKTNTRPAFTTINIAFLPSTSTAPAGYLADNGLAYSSTKGYGWINPTTKAAQSMTANMRIRTGTSAKQLLGLVQMQASDKDQLPGTWEYAVPNGKYRVTIGAGDEGYFDSDHQINAEGLPVISDLITSSVAKHKVAIAVVTVTDGKLTIDANGGINSKMNFITIADSGTVTDTAVPTASLRLVGSTQSAGVYTDQAQVFITATDNGNSGLAQVQYSINAAAYVNFMAPFTLNTAGNYTITIKATDANNNQFITAAYKFSIVSSAGQKTPGVYMVLKNPDGFPGDDQLVFSLIQTPWRRTSPDTTPYNLNHDNIKLRVNNKGTGKLTVSNLKLSNPGSWKITAINTDSTAKLPFSVNSEAFTDVTVKFIAKNAASRIKIFSDTLTIISNDSIAPVKKVGLHGIWQIAGEGLNEPYAQQIIQAFGLGTTTGYAHDDGNVNGTTIVPSSSEVKADYFVMADPSKPVTVRQLAAYHGCCAATEAIRYFTKGSSSTKMVFTHNNLYGQSVVPRIYGSNTNPSVGTFTITGSFGFKAGSASSDRTQNVNGLIGMRILKAIDAAGNVIPNAYLLDCDYLGTQFTNYDYQDNVYYVENIMPESGSKHHADLAALPNTAINFTPSLTGTSSSINVTLKNTGMNYPDSSTDGAITLQSLQIVGPNASEFSVGAFATSSLATQATTAITVKFTPNSVGIKNAALLVNYKNGTSLLRIPLYGIGNTSTSTVTALKRIKGGSDAAVTIGGNTYEADATYRKGSIKLDKQVIASGVAGTDIDLLYQTYLSANAELAQTSYEIPIANGNYLVRMHFVENYWTAVGMRVFHIAMENKQVLNNFDIYNEVGYRAALVKDFSTTVADGSLSIKFDPTANRVGIAAVEIFQVKTTAGASALSANATDSLAEKQRTITVYPNPNNGAAFYLNANNFQKSEKVTLSVTSMSGRLLQKQTFVTDETGAANTLIKLNSSLGKGVYIITAESQTGVLSSKLLVE